MSKTHRLFISHSWKYSDQYETITGWFDEASYFNWINYSIPITNPVDFDSKKELKQKITNKINQVNCVVILAGMYAAHSEWIDYEIDEAVRLGKTIVGVKPWGNEKMPQKIQDYADEIVNWQSSSVVDAVKRNSNA
jgi:MTH538 TIR-like domain (DUF1863)